MPRKFKQNGDKIPNVRTEKAWVDIPIKTNKDTTPLNTESYLVQPRIADYIEKLEKQIIGELPKLPIKS